MLRHVGVYFPEPSHLSISTSARSLLKIFFRSLGYRAVPRPSFAWKIHRFLCKFQRLRLASNINLLGHATEGMDCMRHRSAGKRCMSCKQGHFQQRLYQSSVLATRFPLDPCSVCTLLTYAYDRNNLYMFPVPQTNCSVVCNVHKPQMFRVGHHHFNHFSALVTSYYVRVEVLMVVVWASMASPVTGS